VEEEVAETLEEKKVKVVVEVGVKIDVVEGRRT